MLQLTLVVLHYYRVVWWVGSPYGIYTVAAETDTMAGALTHVTRTDKLPYNVIFLSTLLLILTELNTLL